MQRRDPSPGGFGRLAEDWCGSGACGTQHQSPLTWQQRARLVGCLQTALTQREITPAALLPIPRG
ncbi:hypothetical protein XOCgx_0034 [Xanthomonas oryzae pv. oryzicola]|nr:hypothetical protein XOCgx_0034 [Xanthomonas oryzae pv. oryzicola]